MKIFVLSLPRISIFLCIVVLMTGCASSSSVAPPAARSIPPGLVRIEVSRTSSALGAAALVFVVDSADADGNNAMLLDAPKPPFSGKSAFGVTLYQRVNTNDSLLTAGWDAAGVKREWTIDEPYLRSLHGPTITITGPRSRETVPLRFRSASLKWDPALKYTVYGIGKTGLDSNARILGLLGPGGEISWFRKPGDVKLVAVLADDTQGLAFSIGTFKAEVGKSYRITFGFASRKWTMTEE